MPAMLHGLAFTPVGHLAEKYKTNRSMTTMMAMRPISALAGIGLMPRDGPQVLLAVFV
jgi:hypothetical protein